MRRAAAPLQLICTPRRACSVADGDPFASTGDASRTSDNWLYLAGNAFISSLRRPLAKHGEAICSVKKKQCGYGTALRPNQTFTSPPLVNRTRCVRCLANSMPTDRQRASEDKGQRAFNKPRTRRNRKSSGAPLQNADQDEIGIDKRGLQQNKDDEAQDGKTAVEPVLDSPALNQRIFRLHSDA